jgi:enoyl-CoA hydratase
MTFQNITLEREGAVTVLTVNRPAALNALNRDTFTELGHAADAVAADAGVRVLIVTGAGDKAFVAGADITEFNGLSGPADGVALSARGQGIFRKYETMNKPTIAAVNGFALGGGCEFALACDLRIAADTARLGLPETTLGILPGYGGTQRLARLVGVGMAKTLAFTGAMIDAAEAHRIGLVEQVVPAAELMDTARGLAGKLAAGAPRALAAAKRAINEGVEMTLDEGCALESACFGELCETRDMREGAAAFLEKRPARFTGS